MPRVRLRDDFDRRRGAGVRLDDDTLGRMSVPAGLDDDCADCGDGGAPVSLYPLLTIRERFAAGFDEAGNPKWNWADVVKDQGMIAYEERNEVDDRAGLTVVVATMVFLYPFSSPAIRESATVRTSDGYRWRITGLKRFPDRLQLETERIDDGE